MPRAALPPTRLAAALLALFVLAGPGAWGVDPTELPTPELQARYRALTHELRCVQCQNQSIADSPVGLASDLRREVRDMLLAGKSDDEIRDFMVARYGDFILFRPRVAPRTLWLWATPILLLAIGIFVALRIVRERTMLAANDPSLPEDPLQDEGEGSAR